ncbi:MAG TPA: hypothetical protein VF221_18435 [Chloroflexota bacterium]
MVSAFAAIGEMLNPKSLADIFGAAPGISLATLSLSFALHGPSYVGLEARSMLVGALAMCIYSVLSGWLVLRSNLPSIVVTLGSWVVWLAIGLGGWQLVLR